MIPFPKQIKTVSDMREDAQGLLEATEKSEEPVFIFYKSAPKAVFMSMKRYQELAEIAEDYADSLSAQKFKKEDKKKVKWVSHGEIKELLK